MSAWYRPWPSRRGDSSARGHRKTRGRIKRAVNQCTPAQGPTEMKHPPAEPLEARGLGSVPRFDSLSTRSVAEPGATINRCQFRYAHRQTEPDAVITSSPDPPVARTSPTDTHSTRITYAGERPCMSSLTRIRYSARRHCRRCRQRPARRCRGARLPVRHCGLPAARRCLRYGRRPDS